MNNSSYSVVDVIVCLKHNDADFFAALEKCISSLDDTLFYAFRDKHCGANSTVASIIINNFRQAVANDYTLWRKSNYGTIRIRLNSELRTKIRTTPQVSHYSKITAIKTLRDLAKCGLYDSKKTFDRLESYEIDYADFPLVIDPLGYTVPIKLMFEGLTFELRA